MSCLVWFQFLDSATGLPYNKTSSETITLPSGAVVAEFLQAVKAEYDQPALLGKVPMAALQVYKNQAAFNNRNAAEEEEASLKQDFVITDLGKAKHDRLIVVVPVTASTYSSIHSVPDKLRQLGIEFSLRDVDYLLKYDTAKYCLLKSDYLTLDVAQAVIRFAKSKIKSTTKKAIGLEHSIFLGDPMNVAQEPTFRTSLYYAFSESGSVFTAKVHNGNKSDFMREVQVNEAVEHKNLVKFIKTFSIQNDTRHIIIMPFYPSSVADCFNHTGTVIPLPAIKMIARNCFDALCYLHAKGYCFANVKPSNIMLHNSEPGYATLVDYSATVRMGDYITAFTEDYCLDANTSRATEHLDWMCLGTTLAEMRGFELSDYHMANELVDAVTESGIENCLKTLIISCLENPSVSRIGSALDQFETGRFK